MSSGLYSLSRSVTLNRRSIVLETAPARVQSRDKWPRTIMHNNGGERGGGCVASPSMNGVWRELAAVVGCRQSGATGRKRAECQARRARTSSFCARSRRRSQVRCQWRLPVLVSITRVAAGRCRPVTTHGSGILRRRQGRRPVSGLTPGTVFTTAHLATYFVAVHNGWPALLLNASCRVFLGNRGLQTLQLKVLNIYTSGTGIKDAMI